MLKVEACAECGSRASQDHDAAAALRGILESKLQLINQLRAQSIAFFGAIQSKSSDTVIGFSEDVLEAGHASSPATGATKTDAALASLIVSQKYDARQSWKPHFKARFPQPASSSPPGKKQCARRDRRPAPPHPESHPRGSPRAQTLCPSSSC